MIVLDPVSVSFVSGTVVAVMALTYVIGSIIRRDGGGARLWALAYLLILVTVVVRVVDWVSSAPSSGTEWATGLGNAAMVAAVGCFLLGCRAFNGAAVEGPAFMVGALALLSGAATVASASNGSGQSGLIWTFLSMSGLFIGLVLHTLSGRMRTIRATWGFAIAAAIQAVFTLASAVAMLFGLDEHGLSTTWLGATGRAVLAATAGLVMMTCTFMLRAELADGPRAVPGPESAEILTPTAFRAQLSGVLRRATDRMDVVAVIAVRVEDAAAIGIAFGSEVVQEITQSLRASVRRFSAPLSLVGDGDAPTSMFVATQSASPADARRQAALVYRGVAQALVAEGGIVVPGLGVGVALSQTVGYDATVLVTAALTAAAEAAASEESSVVFAPSEGFAPDTVPPESA